MAEKEESINLGDIKSTYIIKQIFSFLDGIKPLLNMIIYNKECKKGF